MKRGKRCWFPFSKATSEPWGTTSNAFSSAGITGKMVQNDPVPRVSPAECFEADNPACPGCDTRYAFAAVPPEYTSFAVAEFARRFPISSITGPRYSGRDLDGQLFKRFRDHRPSSMQK